jgi:hypothetical protein
VKAALRKNWPVNIVLTRHKTSRVLKSMQVSLSVMICRETVLSRVSQSCRPRLERGANARTGLGNHPCGRANAAASGFLNHRCCGNGNDVTALQLAMKESKDCSSRFDISSWKATAWSGGIACWITSMEGVSHSMGFSAFATHATRVPKSPSWSMPRGPTRKLCSKTRKPKPHRAL